jgi:hypothetical protein
MLFSSMLITNDLDIHARFSSSLEHKYDALHHGHTYSFEFRRLKLG